MGGDHVLVAGQASAKSSVYHHPSDDDPDRPGCRRSSTEGRHYWRVAPDRVPDGYRLCRFCDPDETIDRDNSGSNLRRKLLAMDPDEIGEEGSA